MNKVKIYIRLLEGGETFVPVEAISLHNGTYEIVSNQDLELEDDATSIWEFFPGDIVKCVGREDYLLASELLKSTFPDRKIHELIFQIVNSVGKIKVDDLRDFKKEIKYLCTNDRIIQKQHPLVKNWLKSNCETM